MTWHNRNQFLSPFDPDYDDRFDPEEDYERYCENLEERHEFNREEYDTCFES